MPTTEHEFVKVHFTFDQSDPGSGKLAGESLWAKETEVLYEYELANIPFFADGVALGDTVRAVPDNDGILEVVDVVTRSGNTVVHAHFRDDLDEEKCIDAISVVREHFDCKTERGTEHIWAISVPEASRDAVQAHLRKTGLMSEPADES